LQVDRVEAADDAVVGEGHLGCDVGGGVGGLRGVRDWMGMFGGRIMGDGLDVRLGRRRGWILGRRGRRPIEVKKTCWYGKGMDAVVHRSTAKALLVSMIV
jgi:hypothetical protein